MTRGSFIVVPVGTEAAKSIETYEANCFTTSLPVKDEPSGLYLSYCPCFMTTGRGKTFEESLQAMVGVTRCLLEEIHRRDPKLGLVKFFAKREKDGKAFSIVVDSEREVKAARKKWNELMDEAFKKGLKLQWATIREVFKAANIELPENGTLENLLPESEWGDKPEILPLKYAAIGW